MVDKLFTRTRPTEARDFKPDHVIGWCLNAPMLRLVIDIGLDVLSAVQGRPGRRGQRLAPKGDPA